MIWTVRISTCENTQPKDIYKSKMKICLSREERLWQAVASWTSWTVCIFNFYVRSAQMLQGLGFQPFWTMINHLSAPLLCQAMFAHRSVVMALWSHGRRVDCVCYCRFAAFLAFERIWMDLIAILNHLDRTPNFNKFYQLSFCCHVASSWKPNAAAVGVRWWQLSWRWWLYWRLPGRSLKSIVAIRSLFQPLCFLPVLNIFNMS